MRAGSACRSPACRTLQRALIVGSFLRKDHPLFAARIRQAARKGAQIHAIHALADDWLMPLAQTIVAAPSRWLRALGGIAAAIVSAKGVAAPLAAEADDTAKAIAASLLSGERKAILLGNAAAQHPQASELLALANWIGEQTGAKVGYLTESANTVGAQLVGALPGPGGVDAGGMLNTKPCKAYLLLNSEPALEAANPSAARVTLRDAEMVVSLSPYADANSDLATVMLPIAPFTETSGSFVNAEGRLQSFIGVVASARPDAPGVEGAARARQLVRPDRLRPRQLGAGSRRGGR